MFLAIEKFDQGMKGGATKQPEPSAAGIQKAAQIAHPHKCTVSMAGRFAVHFQRGSHSVAGFSVKLSNTGWSVIREQFPPCV
ncbi:MAG: hypothetical protein ABSF60_14435 [Verrucomicrobiota bacterium]|jgi:hypothetical protein